MVTGTTLPQVERWQTGWQKIDNKWYYLSSDGKMAKNTWVGNWYVNGSGVWVKSR